MGSMVQLFEVIDHILETPSFKPISTGFEALDRMDVRLERGKLYVIGGRPGMGKTSLMLDIALHAAGEENIPVHIFTLAESSEQLALRVFARYGEKAIHITEKDESAHRQAFETNREELESIPLYFYDSAFAFSDIEETIYGKKLSGLIFIDDLQLVDVGIGKYSTSNNIRCKNPDLKRQKELAILLETIAQKANVPIVVLSQVSRNMERRKDKRPVLGDNRYSDLIEQRADAVIFIYRDAYYNPDNAQKPEPAELIVAKNRRGSTGTAFVVFDDGRLSFQGG